MSFESNLVDTIMALLCAALVFVSGPTFSESTKQEGEMIVKFAADHAINIEISTLLTRGDATSKHISNLVTELGNTLGVPLRFQRITSGREVVMDIPRAAARKQLLAHLADTSGVHKAKILCGQEKKPPLEPDDELVVSFNPATAPYQVVAQAAQRASDNPAVQTLISGLTGDTVYRLQGRVLPDKRLVLRMDLAQTASLLAKQMNELDEVDYAQPNFVVKAYP